MAEPGHVLYLVICAAPPAERVSELIDLLQAEGWEVYAIATPTALKWIPRLEIEKQIGRPVLHQQRLPGEPRLLPSADAIAVVPATFNTINAWATGINNTLHLGILNETLGTSVPVIASVYAKPTLTSHPAFPGHCKTLSDAGVRFTELEALRSAEAGGPFRWRTIVDLLRDAKPQHG